MFIKNAQLIFLTPEEPQLDLAAFYTVGIVLVVVGIIFIVAVFIFASTRGSAGKSKVHSAGVVMLGPIPLIFGTDKTSVKETLALALALMIVVLIIYLVFWM
jgi:uncharacterized protein (TIGR00304 family)